MDDSQEQTNNRPWLFQKGKSGNPGGRPKGSISMKEYARRMLLEMDDEQKLEFMNGLNKDKIWEMGEGRASQGIGQADDLKEFSIKLVNYGNTDTPQV